MSDMSTSPQSSSHLFQKFKTFVLDFKEVLSQHRRELSCLSLIAGLILFSYSAARGPSESLFLAYHDRSLLPGLWIEMGLAAGVLVAIYNRLLNYLSLYRLFHLSFITSGVVFLYLLSNLQGGEVAHERTFEVLGFLFPIGPVTLLRIWCDLYIVLLVETFWSLSNLHFSLKSATLIYGFLGLAGSFGSMGGNMLTALYAERWGTVNLIGLTIPSCFVMSLCLWPLGQSFHQSKSTTDPSSKSTLPSESEHQEAPSTRHSKASASFVEGIRVISRSKYLPWLLLLVLSSQVAVTLIDYQYKGMLQEYYPELNDRSAIQGWIYLSIDIGSVAMQLLTGLCLTIFGVGATLFSIPLLLFTLCFIPIFIPAFFVIAAGKSASKFLTYSIFKSAKELVYLPLSYEEQTQGKALIDIMIYRQAKLIASVALILAELLGQGDTQSTGWFTVASIFIWLLISLNIWRMLRISER